MWTPEPQLKQTRLGQPQNALLSSLRGALLLDRGVGPSRRVGWCSLGHGEGSCRVRKSFYTLVVDTNDGNALLMHQPRGRLDVLPIEYARMVESVSDDLPDDLRAYAADAGYLTSMTEIEEEAWFTAHVAQIERAASEAYAAPLFSFVTTYSCNLACSYCFQANSGIRTQPMRAMSVETAEQCLQVLRTAPRHPDRMIAELFGGEPLLPNLRQVVETIVLGCEEIGYRLRATTNGTFLERFEDLLGPTRISELQISLDGMREYHDKRRIPVNGQPTFDKIWRNIEMALSRGTKVMIRANLDKRNVEGFVSLATFLEEQGFLDHPLGELHYIDVQPDPIAPDYGFDTSLPLAEIEAFLTAQAVKHPVLSRVGGPREIGTFEQWVNENFHRHSTRHCGAVTNNVYFAPDLRVYSCHETAGREELATGRVVDGTLVENESAANWRSRRVDNLPGCRKCPYALTCSGGCAARTDIINAPDQSYCNGFDAKFRSVVSRQYQASAEHSAGGEEVAAS